jgi:predicted acyltransferase
MVFVHALRQKLAVINPSNFTSGSERILSVDALRGFDMFWITGGSLIFTTLNDAVKSPATGFLATQMEHVEWTGFRFYDIIMPLFMFLVGVSLPISLKRRLEKSSRADVWKHVLKRVLILWILGMVVQGNLLSYQFSNFRFYSNTLQAIAAGYLIATAFVMYLNFRQQLIAGFALLLVFFVLLYIPLDGAVVNPPEPHHNLALYIDKLLLGSHQDGTTYTWILSSINFGATVMSGVFASYILQSPMKEIRKFRALLFTGIGLIIAGMLVDLIQPVIKHIWTSAFVLFSSGICFMMLALFYLVVDYWKLRKWTFFFIVIGSNSILAYMLGELFRFNGFSDILLNGLKPYLGEWFPFFSAIGGYLVFWLILYHLYKQKIFIRI